MCLRVAKLSKGQQSISLDLLGLLAGAEVGALLSLVVGVDVDDSLFVL